jgi:manganese-dependent inorganic pyrophosphatase
MLLVGIPVGTYMDKVTPLHYDQSLNYVADQIINFQTMLPVVNDENVVVGMISELNLAKSKGKKVILVDHNEMAQAITGIEEAEVLEVIDHHNKSDVTTKKPILVRQEPVGSTGAILNKIFREHDLGMPREIAILLLSTIISDTLYLKSSTATKYDEAALKQLNQTAGLDIDAYAREIFEAKSQIADKSATEILNNDRKEFKAGEVKFAISQVETVNPKALLDRKEELLDCLKKNAEENALKACFLMLTDIFDEGSHVIATAKDNNIYTSLNIKDNYVYMKNVMSRKSDFLPRVYEIM